MKYTDKQGKTYEISYSQKLQQRTQRELRFSNLLKVALLAILTIIVILLIMLLNTGIIGNYLAEAICK